MTPNELISEARQLDAQFEQFALPTTKRTWDELAEITGNGLRVMVDLAGELEKATAKLQAVRKVHRAKEVTGRPGLWICTHCTEWISDPDLPPSYALWPCATAVAAGEGGAE